MKNANSDAEETQVTHGSTADPRTPVGGNTEGKNEENAETRQGHADGGEDEIEKAVRSFWYSIESALREANPGERLNAYLTVALILCSLGVGLIYYLQLRQMRDTTVAAMSAAETAKATLEASNRPWITISHRILSPLAFDVTQYDGPNTGPKALMSFEETIDNVGPGVAVSVMTWETLAPYNIETVQLRDAKLKRDAACDKWRLPENAVVGYTLFPHGEPVTRKIEIGTSMRDVYAIADKEPAGLKGQMAVALVGCVSYRFSFEEKAALAHQTRFIYWLEKADKPGIQPFIIARGISGPLRLEQALFGNTAD